MTVAVQDAAGNTVTTNNSTVTLTLSTGTFAGGGTTVSVAAVNGIATFSNLVISAAGNYTLTASDGTLTGATSSSFTISPTAAAKLTFTQQPTGTTAGTAISPAVTVAVQDASGNTITTNNSTVTLTLSSGTFASGGNTASAAAVNGVATFSNLVINTLGNYTLTAGDGSLTGATSSNFGISPVLPKILSINRESPAGTTTETTSVTYAVTFNEPVTGVTSADFHLVFTGATTASSTVVVSPGSGYNSVYDVTVNNIRGDGTLGLNLSDNGSIVDAYGDHLSNANGSFQAQQTFATGSSPCAVAVGDMNGDGNPDLLVANFESYSIGMMLGNGDGTFQPQKIINAPQYSSFVTVADVNGDGKPDLIYDNWLSNKVSVQLGNGDGTFQARKSYPTGEAPSTIAVADVNGDGKPDLVVANEGNNNVGLLLGNGDGTFQAQETFPTGLDPVSVAITDVNGDGKPDLVVVNEMDNDIGILLGNGNGTFQAQKAFPTGRAPCSLAVADVNGDGNQDLVVTNNSGSNVGVLLGNGDGTFQAQKTVAVGNYPIAVVAADVNGDGAPDLFIANFDDDTVSVLLNSYVFTGQLYSVDQPAQLTFTQPPACTTVGKVINSSTGVQVAVEDSGNATVGIDSSVVTLTLSGGTFADGGTTESVAAVNGVATFSNLNINAVGNYTLTASDGALTVATSGNFMICPLGDVIYAGFINSTNGAADIDAVYAHRGDTTGRYDLNGDGAVNQADVDYLVKTILQTGYADANLDGCVDFLDFQSLLNHWQTAGAGWAGCDFNGDGVTDFMDFQTMLKNWNPAGVWNSSEQASTTASSAGAVQGAAVSQDASQTGAVSMAVSAAPAIGGSLPSNLLIPAGASPAPAPNGLNSQSVLVADLLAMPATSNASVYSPMVKVGVISHRSSLAGSPWTSDNDKVDLLTPLFKPVVA